MYYIVFVHGLYLICVNFCVSPQFFFSFLISAFTSVSLMLSFCLLLLRLLPSLSCHPPSYPGLVHLPPQPLPPISSCSVDFLNTNSVTFTDIYNVSSNTTPPHSIASKCVTEPSHPRPGRPINNSLTIRICANPNNNRGFHRSIFLIVRFKCSQLSSFHFRYF